MGAETDQLGATASASVTVAGDGLAVSRLVRKDSSLRFCYLQSEEFVAGAWHAHLEAAPQRLGTAVGVIRHGKCRIVFSTLGIAENLGSAEAPAHVAKKLFCNFLSPAASR